jgi:ribosomal protein S18 acetylase RimI-like enzyme
MEIQTRPIRPHDLPEVMHMIVALAQFHGDTAKTDVDQLARDVCGPHTWFTVIVAEGGAGDLKGYAALIPLGQLQFGQRGMDMHHLFVRPEARQMGVGAALIDACALHCQTQGCVVMTVGTHPDNDAAAAFYESRGFMRRSPSGPRFSISLDHHNQPPT